MGSSLFRCGRGIAIEGKVMLYLTETQLKRLSTLRLYTYKKKLMKAVETPDWGDDGNETFNKSNPEWQKTYQFVKEILNTRENIERKNRSW